MFHAAPGYTLTAQQCHNLTFRRVLVKPAEGRYFGPNRDGFHGIELRHPLPSSFQKGDFAWMAGKMVRLHVKDCVFRNTAAHGTKGYRGHPATFLSQFVLSTLESPRPEALP